MKILQLRPFAVAKIKKGNRLLQHADLLGKQSYNDGDDVMLVSQTNQFVAKAIIGYQHKGIGWVYTLKKEQQFDKNFVYATIKKAILKRQMMDLSHTSAYRLFNGESDGIGGIVIDWYNDSIVLSWYSYGIYQYKSLILEVLNSILNTQIVSIFEKIRFNSENIKITQVEKTNHTQKNGQDNYFLKKTDNNQHKDINVNVTQPINDASVHIQGKIDDYRVITENGIKYATYLNDGLMTGIFLDQRDVRAYLKQHANGQTILNTFSYTAAFSIAGAMGNAIQTVSVDVAKRSIEKSKEHFTLNNIPMDNHLLYVMDVFDYFKYAQKKKLQFDWVILDPPSFARTKKRTFSVLKNYGDLLSDAIAITKDKGRIIVSTNASNFPKDDVKTMIDTTFKNNGQNYVIEKEFTLPSDFTTLPNDSQTSYLKVFIVCKM